MSDLQVLEQQALADGKAIANDGKAALVALLGRIGTDATGDIPTLTVDAENAALDVIPSAFRAAVQGGLALVNPTLEASAVNAVKLGITRLTAIVNAIP